MASPRTPTTLRTLFALLLFTLPGSTLPGCSAEHHTRRGEAALAAHQLDEAERRFRRAIERDPEALPALVGLGWTYHIAGERVAARQVFTRCRELAQESPDCMRGLASVSAAEGDLTTARKLLGTALALAPDDAGVRGSLALLELRGGEIEAAAEAYDLLARQHPDRAEYHMGLAEARLRQNRPHEARELIDHALALPQTPLRTRAGLWQLQALVLVKASAGLEDPERCAQTAPAVREWLRAADIALDNAEATGIALPDLPRVRRLVLRRRGVVEDHCPSGVSGVRESAGKQEKTSQPG